MKKAAKIFMYLASMALAGLFTSCIGDDIIFDAVEPTLRIMNPVDSLGIDQSHTFTFTYLNNVGQEESGLPVEWSSRPSDIISIDQNGNALALQKGLASIKVAALIGDSLLLADSIEVGVGQETVVADEERRGSLRTTSSYTLEGDFSLAFDQGGRLILTLADN